MSKFIKLTQGSSLRVVVNPSQIRAMQSSSQGTAIYLGLSDAYDYWIVNESLEEIMEMING